MKLSEALWVDLKSDEDRANWLLLGRGYETGIVAKAVQNELAMAYLRLAALMPQAEPTPILYSTGELTAEQKNALKEAGWRAAIEVHSRHGMAGWSSHKEAALSAPQEAGKPEIASGETVDYKPSLQCTCGAEWECGQFGWEMVAAPHTKEASKVEPVAEAFDRKKLLCRVINHAVETGCIDENEGIFLAINPC